MGQYYWSKVCGLCGNLDSNPSNDLEGPLKIRYPDGPSMSAAYLVPDETCDVKQIQQKMGIPEIRRTASKHYAKFYLIGITHVVSCIH